MTSPVINNSRARYLRRSGLATRFQGKFLADLTCSASVLTECDGLVDRMIRSEPPYGVGMILWGSPGRGKTTIAAAALSEALLRIPRETLGRCFDSDAKRPGFYITYAEFIQTYQSSWDTSNPSQAEDASLIQDLFYRNRSDDHWNTRLLVLDDVGKEHKGKTGFNVSTLHDLLRSRYDKSAPTIITTNLAPSDWEASYGDAMASFIREAFRMVNVSGKDQR